MEELSVFRGPVVNFGFVKLVHFADDSVMFMTTQRLYPATWPLIAITTVADQS